MVDLRREKPSGVTIRLYKRISFDLFSLNVSHVFIVLRSERDE